MQTLDDRRIRDVPPTEVDALIEEARRRQRRRWLISLSTLVVVVGLGIGVVAAGPPGKRLSQSTHRNPHPLFAGTDAMKTNIASSVPDLLGPGAMAIEPNGNLLIVDRTRNQILERTTTGQLRVFAGTGQIGNSGNGGNALDAQFNRIQSIALSPSGTLYVSDGAVDDACRLRTIRNGVINTFDTATCVNNLQIGPGGALFGSTDSSIVRVATDGQFTLIAGGPDRHYPVGPAGQEELLDPTSFVFDGRENLIIRSLSFSDVERVTPMNDLTILEPHLAGNSFFGMVGLSNGSVLLSTSEGVIKRVSPTGTIENAFAISPFKIAGYNAPNANGLFGLWMIGSMVEAKDGSIYAVARDEAGNTDTTQLLKISPTGHASVMPISTPLLATLQSTGAKTFPARLYPKPVNSHDPALASCPNPAGIQPFSAAQRATLPTLLSPLQKSNFFADLSIADQSWWQGVFDSWKDYNFPIDENKGIVLIDAASSDTFSRVVSKACGAQLVKDSLVVRFSPGNYYPDVTFFVLNRDGHPLVYLQST